MRRAILFRAVLAASVAGLAPASPRAEPPPPVVKPQGPTQPQKPAQTQGAPAPDPTPGDKEQVKLPRYQSLRSNEVNLRVGPGTRFKIDWVYKRADLPVLVEREFEHWRLIRDADGVQGWVSQATLTGRRTFIVRDADATVLSDPKNPKSAVAVLKPGVIGRLRGCKAAEDWCQIQVAGHNGYLRRAQFWGVLPQEEIGQ